MPMVTVEIRPGVTIRLNAREAQRRGLTPIDPKNHKKAAPAAAKKRKKAAAETAQEDGADGIRNDN
jgi:hypothetical protein